MHIRIATFYLKPEHMNDFITVTTENQQNSRLEPGVATFDFYQGQEDATRFVLYEVFKSDEDFEFHKTTAHFQKWIAAVPAWFIKPRDLALYCEITPV